MVVNIKNIGVIIRNFEESNKKFIGSRRDLFECLYMYDINVIGIPITNEIDKIINLVSLCDGVILSGGDNFLNNDFLLIDYLYKKDIPTLGICLGMQGMGRYLFNKEEEDINNHFSEDKYVHHINIKQDSLLFKIVGKNRILVNSRHKSGFKDNNIFVSSLSDDGIIESVEDNSKKFFLGVEWHPESIKDKYSNKIFDYFINII